MEWERARKKTPFGVRRKLVSSFLSLMRLRKGGSGLPLPLFLARKKPGQIVPPFLRCKCSFAPDLPFAQRSLVQRGFQFINIRPDLFPKIIALYVLGVAFPNALRPHRADIAIRLFRIVNPPQPSGQPSKIPQLQFFPLRAAFSSS